tara:strand:+ start:1335 stop:2996 length:1662 start_codon:yes stop_codon:yes gene_type:complete
MSSARHEHLEPYADSLAYSLADPAAELRAAAKHAALTPESLLVPLGGALWLLRAGQTETERGAVSTLLGLIPSLGGIRLQASILGAAADASTLLRLLGAAPPRLHQNRWSLRYEVLYPGADHNQLPFCSLHAAPELLVGLGTLLGPGFTACPNLSRLGTCDGLLALETKQATILCRPSMLDRGGVHNWDIHPKAAEQEPASTSTLAEREPASPPPLAHVPRYARAALLLCRPAVAICRSCKYMSACPTTAYGASTPGASESGMDGRDVQGSAAGSVASHLALPAWVPRWDLRPFAFSASLDPLVAIAIVNLAACTHEALRAESGMRPTPMRKLHVFDPCCGSGTVLAAASALGHSCSGSDIRAEFLERTRENLEATGFLQVGDTLSLSVHDATKPFPSGADVPDLVVSNPPWGKNFGNAEDSVSIICNVVKELAGATMCWLGSALALEAVTSLPGVKLLHHARLGGVELTILQTFKLPSPPVPLSALTPAKAPTMETPPQSNAAHVASSQALASSSSLSPPSRLSATLRDIWRKHLSFEPSTSLSPACTQKTC